MDKTWCIIGDFNAVLRHDDRMGGNDTLDGDVEEFQSCLDDSELKEMRSFSARYIWTNKHAWSKLDRGLINMECFNVFDFAQINYLAQGLSNHTPMLIAFLPSQKIPSPFRL